MVKLGWMSLLVALAVAVLSITGCVSRSVLDEAQGELAKTQSDLAAATQRVGTLEEQLKASQAALTTAQGDLTKAQKDIATLASDATALKGTLTATQSDVAAAKRELSSVGSDLSALENSSSLTRNDVATVKADLTKVKQDVAKVQTDVTKLNTTDPAERRVGLAILASIEYGVALQTWTATAYETAAGKVTDRVKAIDDSTLTSTWNAVGAARQSVLATTANTPERDAAFGVFRVAIDNFQLRLLQLITG